MKGKIALATLCLALVGLIPVFSQTQHNITLTWTASTTAGVNYNIYRGTASGGPYTKLNTTSISGLTYVDTTGIPGTKYYYVETAVCVSCASGISGESAYSNEASGLFLGSPAPGAGLGAVAN
jgi:fibronectin type 3 domain-containing protein